MRGDGSTSDHWKPFHYLLERRDRVILVNARHVKNLHGRKTESPVSVVLANPRRSQDHTRSRFTTLSSRASCTTTGPGPPRGDAHHRDPARYGYGFFPAQPIRAALIAGPEKRSS